MARLWAPWSGWRALVRHFYLWIIGLGWHFMWWDLCQSHTSGEEVGYGQGCRGMLEKAPIEIPLIFVPGSAIWSFPFSVFGCEADHFQINNCIKRSDRGTVEAHVWWCFLSSSHFVCFEPKHMIRKISYISISYAVISQKFTVTEQARSLGIFDKREPRTFSVFYLKQKQ